MNRPARYWAVVPAAGSGSRMQSDIPKQYLPLAGRAVLSHTLSRLLSCDFIEGIIVAISSDDNYWSSIEESNNARVISVEGGGLRADSVFAALKKLQTIAHQDDYVLVHDAARPCVRTDDIQKLIHAVKQPNTVGGLLAVPAHDTMKRGSASGHIENTVSRVHLWHAQTPQCFPLGKLLNAIGQGLRSEMELTDEASAFEAQGLQPLLVEGRSDNIKITRPADLKLAELYLSLQQGEPS